MESQIQLSVIIPAYNEALTLAGHFDALLPVLNRVAGPAWEIIVVDDGSSDRTSEVVQRYAHPLIRGLRHAPNQGKGAAVRAGVLASRGEAVLLCDADMATPPALLIPFLEALRQGAAIVIGNRNDPRATIRKPQTPLRRFLGRGFVRLAAWVTATSLADYNCGFKLFRGTVAREVLAETTTRGWAYDIEVLALSARRGYRVVELPVEWCHGDNSCVRLPRDLFRTLAELVRIWLRLRRQRRHRP